MNREEKHEARDREARFDLAMERLDGEVAAHEGVEASRDPDGRPSGWLGGEIEPYLVRHPEMLEDLQEVVRAPITPGEAASLSGEGPRFGERLRREVHEILGREASGRWATIADAIDQDVQALLAEIVTGLRDEIAPGPAETVDALRGEFEATRRDLRRQVEEAVERLRYSVSSPFHPKGAPRKDVLDAEPFLAELDRIFGERPAEDTPWTWSRILALVAVAAGWKAKSFVQEYGDDGYALERFLEAEGEEDIDEDDGDRRGLLDEDEHEPAHDCRSEP